MQKFLGTKQDGYVGPKTRKLLNNSCGDEVASNKTYSGDLKIMYGEDSVKTFLTQVKKEFLNNHVYSRSNTLMLDGLTTAIVETKSLSLNTTSSNSGDSSDFSKTNIQVSGVDEADIVKTDGRYIYTLNHNKISIVDTKSTDSNSMKEVSSIHGEKNENIKEMYLNGEKLIIISNYYLHSKESSSGENKKRPSFHYYNRSKNFTRVEIYNITNPTNLTKEKQIDFEGNYKESRLNNNHLYIISNKSLFEDSPIIPLVKVNGEVRSNLGNDVYYVDAPFTNYNLTSISAINLNNIKDISSKRILMPYGGKIYMSKNNLYMTYNKYNN
jgi:uncharacterized secreted protein with C-terminal beta-propeller domain